MSTPNITSPSGLPAVSTALDTIVPVSPAMTRSTSMPVSSVNAARASLSDVPFVRERVVGDEGDRRRLRRRLVAAAATGEERRRGDGDEGAGTRRLHVRRSGDDTR